MRLKMCMPSRKEACRSCFPDPSVWMNVYGVAAKEMRLADSGFDALQSGGSDCQKP